jgi:hypothetical protein
MSRILAGAVGVLVLQALLVGGYLAVSRQDPIVLNPDRGDWSQTASWRPCIAGTVAERRC